MSQGVLGTKPSDIMAMRSPSGRQRVNRGVERRRIKGLREGCQRVYVRVCDIMS